MDGVTILGSAFEIIASDAFPKSLGKCFWDLAENDRSRDIIRQAVAFAAQFGEPLRAVASLTPNDGPECYLLSVHPMAEQTKQTKAVIITRQAPAATMKLTDREVYVTALTARGLSTTDIGTKLGVTIATVNTHRARARAKLGVTCAAELHLYASAFPIPSDSKACGGTRSKPGRSPNARSGIFG